MKDDHHLLSRYRRLDNSRREAEHAHRKARAAFDAGHPNINITSNIGDPADARGIPVVTHGVAGASPGTSPHALPFLTPSERAG